MPSARYDAMPDRNLAKSHPQSTFFGTEPCSYQGRRPLHSPPLFSFLTGSLEVVATLPVCWLGWTEHWSGAVAELGRAEPLALHGALV